MTSAHHHQILLDSWRVLEPHSDRASALFFDRLRSIDPDSRALFERNGHADLAQTFRRMVAELIALHDDPRDLVIRSAELGRRHARYGVRDSSYRSVLDALLWVVEVLAPSLDTAAVHAAWNEAFALVAAVMRRAGSSTTPVGR